MKGLKTAGGLIFALAGLRAAASPAPPPSLGLGVVSVYNPRLMYLKFQPLVDYLTGATGSPWNLVVVPSYERLVQDLCSGKLTVAYLGPFAYARAHAACKALPVVKLATGGKPTYRGLIMVRADSPLKNLPDLAGKRIGFGPPMASASYLEGRAILEEAGLHPGLDVACRHYAHHEEAARAVLLGEVDACGVREIVGEKYTRRGLRVLARSEEIPNFVLALAPGSEPALPDELVRALVLLPRQDSRTAEMIRSWDEELAGGFLPASDADYEAVRRLAVRLFGPSALTLPEASLECRPGRR
jgi:phosphonate transport system substrate-binding protein